jgi:hypothetical protein
VICTGTGNGERERHNAGGLAMAGLLHIEEEEGRSKCTRKKTKP